jgi:hypothetical protein
MTLYLSVCGLLLLKNAHGGLEILHRDRERLPVAALARERIPQTPEEGQRDDDHGDVVDVAQRRPASVDEREPDGESCEAENEHHHEVLEVDVLRKCGRMGLVMLGPLLQYPLLAEPAHRDRGQEVDGQRYEHDHVDRREDDVEPNIDLSQNNRGHPRRVAWSR